MTIIIDKQWKHLEADVNVVNGGWLFVSKCLTVCTYMNKGVKIYS